MRFEIVVLALAHIVVIVALPLNIRQSYLNASSGSYNHSTGASDDYVADLVDDKMIERALT